MNKLLILAFEQMPYQMFPPLKESKFYATNKLSEKKKIKGNTIEEKRQLLAEEFLKEGIDFPPPELHFMGNSAKDFFTGGLYYCDLITECLSVSNVSQKNIKNCLDFGGSSGRVAFMFSYLFPKTKVFLCDPIKKSVNFVQSKFQKIDAFSIETTPPFPNENKYDFIFAISIWSHYNYNLGRKWLIECHNKLNKNGILLITTHGVCSVFHETLIHKDLRHFKLVHDSLINEGFFFWNCFPNNVDFDNDTQNSEWGHMTMTDEYVRNKLIIGLFNVIEYFPGRNASQDVYVLRKKAI